jgi:alginate O-acetyltransferase complex protein AlgJ
MDAPASQNVELRSTPAPPTLSREEQARKDLCGTVFFSGAKTVCVLGFLLTVCAGILMFFLQKIDPSRESLPSIISRLFVAHPPENSPDFLSVLAAKLPSPALTKEVEKKLEDNAPLVRALRPYVQQFFFQSFHLGNEQVTVAPQHWLFFRKDLDYVNGADFMDSRSQRIRRIKENASTDPIAAITEFQQQLAERGIRLILLPIPVKPCIEGDRLAPPTPKPRELNLRQNAGFAKFLDALNHLGISVFDPAPLLFERLHHTAQAQYIQADTHWTPDAMEAVAYALANFVNPKVAATPPQNRPTEIVASLGDTAELLGLPKDQNQLAPQTVTIHPRSQGVSLWTPSPTAEILLLGDSFTNIFSLHAMGWGQNAGLAEHLSQALSQPLDVIARNSDGAFATRQILQRELAAGRDRLKGKKVLIWEFAVRELAFGDWKHIPLETATPQDATFYCPPPGKTERITGTLLAASPIPAPGSVPYKEHIACLHLVDVDVDGSKTDPRRECLVFTWSIQNRQLSAAASLHPGDRITLSVQSWEDVAETREKFQRSELDDVSLLAQPLLWSEGTDLIRR